VHFPSNCGLLVHNTGGLDGVLPHFAGPSSPPPPSHAGRGCPRTPAWSPLQVAHTPRNGFDCAAVARPSVDRSQLQHLRARRGPSYQGRATQVETTSNHSPDRPPLSQLVPWRTMTGAPQIDGAARWQSVGLRRGRRHQSERAHCPRGD